MTSTSIPEGSVVITPIEMYREMQATHQAVRDVSGKLDGALEAHARRLDDHDRDVADHESRLRPLDGLDKKVADQEGRIRSVETRVWQAVGATTILSAAAGALVTYLTTKP
jgi:hypothetical protein